MARIEIEDGHLLVHIEGLFDQVMSLRSSIKIPLSHLTGVRAHPPELLDETWILRVFGASFSETHIGYFWKKGDGLVFCDIHDRKDVLALDLKEERMKHLYLQVTDEAPESACERIQAALAVAR